MNYCGSKVELGMDRDRNRMRLGFASRGRCQRGFRHTCRAESRRKGEKMGLARDGIAYVDTRTRFERALCSVLTLASSDERPRILQDEVRISESYVLIGVYSGL